MVCHCIKNAFCLASGLLYVLLKFILHTSRYLKISQFQKMNYLGYNLIHSNIQQILM